MVYDPTDEENIFASTSEVRVYRHLCGHKDRWPEVTPRKLTQAERGHGEIAVMAIDPKDPRTVWLGTTRLWTTSNQGKSWRALPEIFDGSPISAIEIAEPNPKYMLVGTSNGGIFRSVNGGKSWSENLSGLELPGRLISRIDILPKPQKDGSLPVVVTVAGSGVGKYLTLDAQGRGTGGLSDRGFSHVFLSVDGGATYADQDSGTLPPLPFHAAVYETWPPYRVFVGGDFGVYMGNVGEGIRPDTGARETVILGWTNITGNMTPVIVTDLVYHHKDRVLTAATYGRGIWQLKMDEAGWLALGSGG